MLNAWNLNSAGIFRHRFKKKGRNFAVSAGYNNSKSDGTDNLFSINQFFQATTFTDQVRQLNNRDNLNSQIKSSVLYTEPLSKILFWESFYNFSQTDNTVNRQTLDPENNNERIDNLSVYYKNRVLYNRAGTDIRYSNEGLDFSIGLAAQQLELNGEYAIDKGLPLLTDPINQKYLNLIPNADLSYEFSNNMHINTGYSYTVTEPQFSDLQPVPNVNNPAFQTVGNPDLRPERSHTVSAGLYYWNPASFSNLGFGSDLNIYDTRIVYSQTIEYVDSIGLRTIARPENVSGGYRFGNYFWGSYPIIKTKLTLNLNGNMNLSASPAFVNGIENETRNQSFGGSIGLNLTPGQKLLLGVSGDANFNNISYSIQEQQNQKIRNYSVDGSVKWQFIDRTFLESNFDYNIYRNDRFGFNQDIPIWNASIRRLIGPKNKIEVRLAAFDLLNKRVYIRQYGSQNYVTRTIADTLARYYMLSVSYNVRGYENKLKTRGMW